MKNFTYCTPTKLVFGKDSINKLVESLKPYGKRVLLTYGGGSIKKIGLYDKVIELLKDFEVYELPGIEPNPKYYQSVVPGVKICKEKNIDVILAVGGGSVLDCSKAIAGGAKYDGETWDLFIGKALTKDALPIVDILTLAATGSEYDAGGVISRPETNDKLAYMSPYLYPKVSILDPTYTFSVSKKQTAAGTADAINHVIEQFFTYETTILNDGMCAAAIKSLMQNVKIALNNPEDYDARAQLMFDCTLACNGIFAKGNSSSGWPCHGIEHALSGFYDITHGEGLAIITPWWMRHILNDYTLPRFVKFATDVMDVEKSDDLYKVANEGINRLEQFFKDINIPMSLKEVGIDSSRIDEMAKHIDQTEGLNDPKYNYVCLSFDDIKDILTKSL